MNSHLIKIIRNHYNNITWTWPPKVLAAENGRLNHGNASFGSFRARCKRAEVGEDEQQLGAVITWPPGAPAVGWLSKAKSLSSKQPPCYSPTFIMSKSNSPPTRPICWFPFGLIFG